MRAFGLFVLLAVFHLAPLSFVPWRLALHGNADTYVSEWLVSWIAHTLPRDPVHIFDTNIFAPERQTLTYGDPVLLPALIAAPVRWLGGSPVLAFNVTTIVGLVLTALATWLVARQWFGATGAALLAGTLGAFNIHLLTRLAHLPATHLWAVPLALLVSDRLVDVPSRRDAIRLALVVLAAGVTSMYTLALTLLTCGVVALVALVGAVAMATPRQRHAAGPQARAGVRASLTIAVASIGGLLLALPVLLPYLRFALAGHSRPLEMVAEFSATPSGYLASTSVWHQGWSKPFFSNDVNALFAGLTALVFGVLGLGNLLFSRDQTPNRRRAMTLVVLAGVGILLSLGPATAIYRWSYDWFPPLRGLRVAARFGYLWLLALSIAGAAGLSAVCARVGSSRVRAAVVTAAIVMASAEAWQGPVPARTFTGVPRIYELLSSTSAPEPVVLVEVPFYPPEAVHENAAYMLGSTAHWRPLMNGYSGFTPDSYRARTSSFWFFPEPWAVDAIVRDGATHVMVHLDRFGAERPAVERAVSGLPNLRLLAADPGGRRLYAVVR